MNGIGGTFNFKGIKTSNLRFVEINDRESYHFDRDNIMLPEKHYRSWLLFYE